MTNKELIVHQQQTIEAQAQKVDALETQLKQLVKLIYGQKSERFIAENLPDQLQLFVTDESSADPIRDTETIQYERNKPKAHPGCNAIPEHLPVEEVVLEPEATIDGLRKIGEEITETLSLWLAVTLSTRI